MGMHDFIKTLYDITWLLFMFIAWSIVGMTFLQNKCGGWIFLITVIELVLMKWIKKNTRKPFAIHAVPILFACMIAFAFKSSCSKLNFAYLCVIPFIMNYLDRRDVNFYMYLDEAQKSMAIMVFLGLAYPLACDTYDGNVYRFFIIYIIILVTLLRNSRDYYYHIISKSSTKYGILLCLLMACLSIEKVFLSFVRVIRIMALGVIKVLEPVVGFIVNILVYLSMLLGRVFPKIQLKSKLNVDFLQGTQRTSEQDYFKDYATDARFAKVVTFIIIVVVVLLLIKIVKSFNHSSFGSEEDIEISREKIKVENGHGILGSLKEKFERYRTKDYRTQILHVYRKFMIKANDKGLYDKNMTAAQLKNITNIHINDEENLNILTKTYNQAKFSKGEPDEIQAMQAKASFSSIKNKM